MKRRIGFGAVVILLLLAAALAWLGGSQAGLQWAYRQAQPWLPGTLEINRIEGRLFGPIRFEKLRYRDAARDIRANDLVFDWNPWALLGARLEVELIESGGIEIDLASTPATAEPGGITEISLPLELTLRRLVLSDLRFASNGNTTSLQRLEANLELRRSRLEIASLEARAESWQLGLDGSVEITPELVHDLGLEWTLRLPSRESLAGKGRLSGDLQRTRLQQDIDGAARARLELEADAILQQLQWRGELRLDAFDTARIDPALEPLRGSLRLSASGDLRSASADGLVALEESRVGAIQSGFRLRRLDLDESGQSLDFDGLELELLDGTIGASGSFAWAPGVRWQAQVSAAGIDPQALDARWPGRIDGEFAVDGRLETGAPEVKFDIDRINGELRGYPLDLRGAGAWQPDRVSLSGIELRSGKSRVSIDGSLMPDFGLRWSLDSDDLAELYPDVRGRVSANGRLDGPRARARLTAAVVGSGFGFEELTAGGIDADVALELDLGGTAEFKPQALTLDLETSELSLGQHRLRRLALGSDGRRWRIGAVADHGMLDAELRGEFVAGGWRGQIIEASLQNRDYGEWRLKAPAAIAAAPGTILLEGLCLDNPRSGNLCADLDHRQAAGSARIDLEGLPLPLLEPWLPAEIRPDGAANASANLDYRLPRQLQGKIDIELPPGRVGYAIGADKTGQVEYERAQLRAQLGESGVTAQLDADLGSVGSIGGTIELPGASPLDFDAGAQKLQAAFDIRLRELGLIDAALPQVEGLSGKAEIDLEVGGTLATPRLGGSARLRDVALFLPQQELEIHQLQLDASSSEPDRIDYTVRAEVAGGSLAASGRASFDAGAGWRSRLQLDGQRLAIAPLLRRHLPEPLQLDGSLDLGAELELQMPGRLTGKLSLESASGTLGFPLPNAESASWRYRDIRVDIRLADDGADLSGGFEVGANRLQARLRLPRFDPFALAPQSQALDGTVEMAFDDLSITESLLPDVQRTSGSLRLALQIGGTLAQPEIRGRAEMRDAGLQIARLGLELQQVELSAASDVDGTTRFSASLRSGEGRIDIEGSSRLDRAAGWPTTITLQGENFEIARIPEARVSVSPRLEIGIVGKNIDIGGEVLVPYAKLQPRDITTATRVSNDTVIVGAEQDASERWQINSSVRLILGERVSFFGYGFDGRLGGSLLIEETPGKPARGSGEITIVEGRYRAYGQHLDVEQGRLLFSGGPLTNPGLDIRAVRKTGDVTAGIKVSGRLQNPRLDLYSVPAMGQTETLSYLLTGRPLDSASSDEGAMMANAALALGLSGGDRIARSIGDRFGFDEMRIEGSSSGDQASLVVGRYLSPRLYVGYGVGLIESINTLNLRYSITERWQLEAESGQEHGADLFYTFER